MADSINRQDIELTKEKKREKLTIKEKEEE